MTLSVRSTLYLRERTQSLTTFSRHTAKTTPIYFISYALHTSYLARVSDFRQFDGLSLLRLAKEELSRAGVQLAAVQFVACEEPLDLASPTSAATLWVYRAAEGGEGDVEQLTVEATGIYV